MSLAIQSSSSANLAPASNGGLKNLRSDLPEDSVLYHRLKLVEEIWESVLQSECGQELVDLLKELRSRCSPEDVAAGMTEESLLAITERIEKLELNDAIRAARAFALYFQLINIVEQHYEQREQEKNRWESAQNISS